MNYKKIYHLNIPRTSGFGVANALDIELSQSTRDEILNRSFMDVLLHDLVMSRSD
jgi:hypothetical protein